MLYRVSAQHQGYLVFKLHGRTSLMSGVWGYNSDYGIRTRRIPEGEDGPGA